MTSVFPTTQPARTGPRLRPIYDEPRTGHPHPGPQLVPRTLILTRDLAARALRDPRHYQLAVLGSLLLYGKQALDLSVSWLQIGVTLSIALVTQWLGTVWVRSHKSAEPKSGVLRFDFRSPFISGLSLCLLLRTDALWLAAAGAVLAIGSKFVIHWRGKHVFNPTNFGLAVLLLATDRVWLSPGQWGSVAFLAFLVAGLGSLVVYRAERSDVTWTFLGAYASLLMLRAIHLGDPLTIPLHQLQSGAFLIFTFYMISDPRTTPASRPGRILFAILVALCAWYVHFRLFTPNGFLWSLFFLTPLVPAIDALLPGRRYEWANTARSMRASAPLASGRLTSTPLTSASPRAGREKSALGLIRRGDRHCLGPVQLSARTPPESPNRDLRRLVFSSRNPSLQEENPR